MPRGDKDNRRRLSNIGDTGPQRDLRRPRHNVTNEELDDKLEQVLAGLAQLSQDVTDYARAERRRDQMAQADIDRLKTAVERNRTVTDSAVTLINGLAQQIRDAGDDPQELQTLANDIEQKAQSLADAITANTPQQPEQPPA